MEPRVRHAHRHSRPPLLAPPPRAPRPRASPWPPPAGTAPPPAPLYGQSSPGRVRQWRPRPSPCVTERLRDGSGSPGEPQWRRLLKLGECSRRTAERTRDQAAIRGAGPGQGGAGAGRVGAPAGSVHLFWVLHEGDGCTRGQKECCRVGVQEREERVALVFEGWCGWSGRTHIGVESAERGVGWLEWLQGGSRRGFGLAPGMGTCPANSWP